MSMLLLHLMEKIATPCTIYHHLRHLNVCNRRGYKMGHLITWVKQAEKLVLNRCQHLHPKLTRHREKDNIVDNCHY